MIIGKDYPISLSELIQPKIEVEIAYILKDDLTGPGATVAEVFRCTTGFLPAFEVIDSRIKGWKIKIQDIIADNGSIGRVILGSPLSNLYRIDLRSVGVVVRKNGKVIETAAGAAVLGNPVESVVWLANKLSERGMHPNAGEIVLSGSLIAPIEIKVGDVIQAEFGCGLGAAITYVAKEYYAPFPLTSV